jgi:purine-binding chemotaxis protein CheW
MAQDKDLADQARRQFITFRSGDQEFGADIMCIREIRGWTATTSVPHAPDFVRGIINLRGNVLPVVDLKARLGRGATSVSETHVIIVVNSAEHTIGLLVDAVSDILTTSAGEIQGTSDFFRDGESNCVEGIAVLGERMVTILGIEKLMTLVGYQALLGQAA